MLSSAYPARFWWVWDAIVLVLAASVVLTSRGLLQVDHTWWTGLVGILLSLISIWRIASQCPSYKNAVDGRDGLLAANCAEQGEFSCWNRTCCYVAPNNDTELADYCCIQGKYEITIDVLRICLVAAVAGKLPLGKMAQIPESSRMQKNPGKTL